VLHRQLLERAGAAGIELHWGVPVTGLAGSRVETPAGAFPGRFLVGADGLRSAVRRWAGLDGPAARRQRFGVRHHFAVAPWTDLVEVYWADGAEAYVTPVGDREVGVAMLWDRRRARGGFDLLLARFPDLARRLSGAPATSRDRGCGPLEQRVRTVCRGPVALLGDAAGYLDAITGEGLSLAFHQGAALVEAITAGDLARYRTVCRRLHRLPQALTRFLLAIERRPRRVERLIRLLARHPDLFDRALAVLARQAPLRSFGLRAVGRTALGLLWG
jgi:flavin-dependent dehydrogenase